MSTGVHLRDDSRPSLFGAIADMIERFSARIPASAVLGNTPVNNNVRMQIQLLFRAEGVLRPDEFIEGNTPDAILESLEETWRRRP